MEDIFVIKGGNSLKGDITLSGSKNITTKVIIASLLSDSPVTLTNVPKINDVLELIILIQKLGGKAEFIDDHTLVVDKNGINTHTLDLYTASKIRVSFMLFAPLLHTLGIANIPNPGGCRLGARSIDRIVDGIEALGATIEYNSATGYYEARLDKAINGSYTFVKPSHTGTETLIMMGVLGSETTVIHNAATEPEVDYLITFLQSMGACIERIGNTITIQGVPQLTAATNFSIPSDRNEAISYAALAIATKGDIAIHKCNPSEIATFISYTQEAGGGVEIINDTTIRFYYKGELKATDVTTGVHPAFMTDWQPLWAILMTQANGKSTIHETMFENRFEYVKEFNKLGAHIQYIKTNVINPHETYGFNYEDTKQYKQKIMINGKTTLHSGILAAKDLRAGASLVVAALVAPGESIVRHASIIGRGYDNIVQKIKNVGGVIERK
jgi:UDP-N-acetylglucosamine 1-carboxyvinyltransferase